MDDALSIAHVGRGRLVRVPRLGVALAHDPGDYHADEIVPPTPSLPLAKPGAENMELLDIVDNDGTCSDLAFYGDYAYVGSYDGFKIVDIRRPGRLRELSDTPCRANQGDVSVFDARPAADPAAVDRPPGDGAGLHRRRYAGHGGRGPRTAARARFGYEGLRMFDVTDPRP